MVAIINRNPSGRIISLHAEIKYLTERYGDNKFPLVGLKYDENEELNPLMYFHLAKEDKIIGIYDPYLQNPLSKAKFHLTQSVQLDNQKSKSASDTANALEALGWIKREEEEYRITDRGKEVSRLNHETEEFFNSIRKAVLEYGPFIGFLFICKDKANKEAIINRDEIVIGYPSINEHVLFEHNNVPISSGSTEDTIIRTKSILISWAISTGFALPLGYEKPDRNKWFIDTLPLIAEKKHTWKKLKLYIPNTIFNGKHYVEKPLNYDWMTKNTRALRERGQDLIRQLTMKEEHKIKNRRFTLIYCLARAAEQELSINFKQLISIMKEYPNYYVINDAEFDAVMEEEINICITTGLPFHLVSGDIIPLTRININEICNGAPSEIILNSEEIFKRHQTA